MSGKVDACTLLETLALLNFWEMRRRQWDARGHPLPPSVQTMRGHPLFALTAEREKEEGRRENHIDVDEGEWGRREGQNAGSAAYNAGRRSQSGRNAITLTRNPITYSFT